MSVGARWTEVNLARILSGPLSPLPPKMYALKMSFFWSCNCTSVNAFNLSFPRSSFMSTAPHLEHTFTCFQEGFPNERGETIVLRLDETQVQFRPRWLRSISVPPTADKHFILCCATATESLQSKPLFNVGCVTLYMRCFLDRLIKSRTVCFVQRKRVSQQIGCRESVSSDANENIFY